jgi:hypothetical protein
VELVGKADPIMEIFRLTREEKGEISKESRINFERCLDEIFDGKSAQILVQGQILPPLM